MKAFSDTHVYQEARSLPFFFNTQNDDSKASHLHLPAAKRKRMTAIECIFLLIFQPESRVKCELNRVVYQMNIVKSNRCVYFIISFISPNANDPFGYKKCLF